MDPDRGEKAAALLIAMRAAAVALAACVGAAWAQSSATYDIVIYGATPAGFAAAIAASRWDSNLKVALLEPTGYVGGMAGPGCIGLRDIGDPSVMNSTALEWGRLNGLYYNVSTPVWQPDAPVANASFWHMMRESPNLSVFLEAVLVPGSVQKSGTVISSFQTSTGSVVTTWQASYFMDASYEGDLMVNAGASYTWGRESEAEYNESLAGVTGVSQGQFSLPVDPYWSDGTLLEWVQDLPDPRTMVGQADGNLMAYSYRVCLTTNPANQAPLTPPPNYNRSDFELVRRYVAQQVAAGQSITLPWGNLGYSNYPPGDKFDACCGMASVGIDAVGLAVGYPNGSYAERAAIAARHRYYVQGTMWFWTWDTESGVPAETQAYLQKYALCADTYPETGHFPPQLYVREANRLVGDQVYTQNDRYPATGPYGCRNDSVAVAAWGIDIHGMSRTAVLNSTNQPIAFDEGLTSPSLNGTYPFELPYWVLTPKRAELSNLLVPNCPSVSHVAFAAIREEPTLWQLGQAGGTALALLLQQGGHPAVQDVDIDTLQQALLQQGLVIHMPARQNCSSPAPAPPSCNTTLYNVSGAGLAALDGIYRISSQTSDGLPVWVLETNAQYALYRYGGQWHIATSGQSIWYESIDYDTECPPSGGWKPSVAAAPAPSVNPA